MQPKFFISPISPKEMTNPVFLGFNVLIAFKANRNSERFKKIFLQEKNL